MIDERLDKTVFSFTAFDEADGDDIDYWHSKTPTERIEALECLRRCVWGDKAIDAGVQRVFEFAQLGDE
jgi:hypothetical protein